MGLTDFAAGWALGAKTGNQGFDDVINTAKGIFSSKEFQDFLAAVRSHAAFALREMGDLVDAEMPNKTPSGDLVDFVRALAERRDAAIHALRGAARGAPPEA